MWGNLSFYLSARVWKILEGWKNPKRNRSHLVDTNFLALKNVVHNYQTQFNSASDETISHSLIKVNIFIRLEIWLNVRLRVIKFSPNNVLTTFGVDKEASPKIIIKFFIFPVTFTPLPIRSSASEMSAWIFVVFNCLSTISHDNKIHEINTIIFVTKWKFQQLFSVFYRFHFAVQNLRQRHALFCSFSLWLKETHFECEARMVLVRKIIEIWMQMKALKLRHYFPFVLFYYLTDDNFINFISFIVLLFSWKIHIAIGTRRRRRRQMFWFETCSVVLCIDFNEIRSNQKQSQLMLNCNTLTEGAAYQLLWT